MTDYSHSPSVSDVFTAAAGPWLLLSRLPGFGIRRRQAVANQFPDFLPVVDANPATLKAMGLTPEARDAIRAWQQQDSAHPLIRELTAIWHHCCQTDTELVTWADADYPEPLRHIHDAPLLLYIRGNRSLLGRDQIGIVGSRNASRQGLDHARSFAAALSERGYLVTSGMALGVDGAAHAGAMDAGFATVAVIGTGVDRPYPHQHRALCQRIIDKGVLVSEYPPGTAPKAGNFPKRNRIISGLSRGILVVEASLKSGSLITARLALEQGREVFAIPGSIHNPLARGCHELIRQGARLVETVDDIAEELGAWWSSDSQPVEARPNPSRELPRPAVETQVEANQETHLETDLEAHSEASLETHLEAHLEAHLEPREIAVLEALGYHPLSTDDLCSATGLPADQLMQSLLLLELQGLVDAAPGGFQKVG